MPAKIIVPDFGPRVGEIRVGRWIRSEGDFVRVGETVVELETEPLNAELSAQYAGSLTIIQEAGAIVAFGDTLGTITAAPHLTNLEPIYAHLLKARPLRRSIRLSGAINATVEYDGWGQGYESVSVDGRVVTRVKSQGSLAPILHFELPGPEGTLPATLQVWTVNLRLSLRLTVGDRVLWSEGRFGAVGERSLPIERPIPATAPRRAADDLPVSIDAPVEGGTKDE